MTLKDVGSSEYERLIDYARNNKPDDRIAVLEEKIRQLGAQIDSNNEVIAHLSKHTDEMRLRVEQLARDNRKLVDMNEEQEQYIANLRQPLIG